MTRLLGAAAALLLVAATPAAAQQQPPGPLLPPHPTREHLPFDGTQCADGERGCIVRTVAEMYRRINAVIPVCDHRAPFAVAYLRVTEEWRRRLDTNFFADAAWTEHIDRVFANLYFKAYDNYAAGRRDAVPPAWALAFDIGRQRGISALGNFLLEFNAHVNRDLPFALAEVGTTAPDGSSRKPDYDRGNDIVVKLGEPVSAELTARFDETTDDLVVFPLDQVVLQMFLAWRERTWRNAERLLAAPTPEARQRVADEIEDQAYMEGKAMLELLRYRGTSNSAARDAHCARNGGQTPSAYQPAAAAPRLTRGRIAVRKGRALVRLTCPGPSFGCSGRVAIVRGRRTAGRRTYTIASGATAIVRVKVARSARGRARVRVLRDGVPAAERTITAPARLVR